MPSSRVKLVAAAVVVEVHPGRGTGAALQHVGRDAAFGKLSDVEFARARSSSWFGGHGPAGA
jgi:hypothetical protein